MSLAKFIEREGGDLNTCCFDKPVAVRWNGTNNLVSCQQCGVRWVPAPSHRNAVTALKEATMILNGFKDGFTEGPLDDIDAWRAKWDKKFATDYLTGDK